jgi:hypothetical protein
MTVKPAIEHVYQHRFSLRARPIADLTRVLHFASEFSHDLDADDLCPVGSSNQKFA